MDVFLSGLWGDINGQDFYFREYDTPSTNNGISHNLDRDRYYGVLTTLMYRDFTVLGSMTSREKGIPTGAYDVTFNDPAAKTLDERKFLELKYDYGISADKYLVLRGYLDHYGYRGTYPYSVLSSEASDGNWLGNEVRFQWDTRSDNRFIVGTEYKDHFRADYRQWDADTTYFNHNFPYHVLSLYLQDEYQVMENLSVTLGLLWSKYSTLRRSTTPRGAIIYHPIRSGTLKLLYGEAFRAPSIYEADYEEPFSGAKANHALRPETIRTAEAIWEQRLSDELFGIVSLYNYTMKDLIDQTIDPSDSLLQFRNVSRVKARGVELDLDVHLKMGIEGCVNYVFQRAEDPDVKKKLTNSPQHSVKIGLAYPVVKHVYTAAELQYESERITVYGTSTDPYLLTNLNVSTRSLPREGTPLTELLHHARFSFFVNNLFNVTYKTPGGFEHKQPAIAQNGRNFAVKLDYTF